MLLSLHRARVATLALAWAACASACAPARESELLEVRRVAPDRIEPGHLLQIRGAGFPPGRAGRIRLEGQMHPPGASARAVAIELEAQAVSSEEVEARFTGAALAALGGRGTLHGRVTVIFAAAQGTVIGRSPRVVLDVIPESTDRLGEELARRRRGAELAERLGLTLGEEAPDEPGLPVELVAEGSIGARAGLASGDRLIALEDVRLHALSDFVAPPARREARLAVLREGEAAPFVVLVPAGVRREHVLSQGELIVARVALGWVLLVLLLLAPSARFVQAWLRGPAAPSRPRAAFLARHGRALLRGSIGAALLLAIVGLDHAGLLVAPLEAVVLVALAARTSAAYLSGQTGRATPFRALAPALSAAGAVLVVALALACVAAIGGTTDLAALHRMQGPAPWEWTALRTPAGPLLTASILAAGAWSARERKGRVAGLAGEAMALVLAAVVAAVLLGGFSAGEAASEQARALAAVAFIAKGLLAWSVMRRAGTIAWTARDGVKLAVALLAAMALTAAWIAWEPGAELERALAEVLTAALALTLVLGWARPRLPIAPARPFL